MAKKPKSTAGTSSPAPAARAASIHTAAVHAGSTEDEVGAITTPLRRTATFRFATVDALRAAAAGRGGAFYTRYGHPNFEAVEAKFAALHAAEDAVLFGSGTAAFAGILQAYVSAGDRIVAVADLYGGTRVLLKELEERFRVSTTLLPLAALSDGPALDRALVGARLLVAESPTNPMLRVLDLPELAARARRAGVLVAFDNTFATPVHQRPLRMGVDLVWESATKALGGHSDLVAGIVAGSREAMEPVRRARRIWGAISDPDAAWLLERGMKTLGARVERQAATAAVVAAALEKHPAVSRVVYPGLPSHPDHAIAKRLLDGFGAMVTFGCRGGLDAARRVAERVRLVANAPSLGGVESLLSLPLYSSQAFLTPAERAACDVTDDLVRLSIGLEDAADLIADLNQALEGAARSG